MVLNLWFISAFLTSDCLIWEGPVQYQLKIKGLQYLFWQIPYRYNRGICGEWKFSTTHREKRKKRLWSPFLFSHLWDSIYWIMMILRLQRHVPIWNTAPDSMAVHGNLFLCPFGCSKGPNCKPGKHEPFQKGWSLSLGFLSFLVGTIWVSAANYLQVHFCCMQWSEFPIRLLQV